MDMSTLNSALMLNTLRFLLHLDVLQSSHQSVNVMGENSLNLVTVVILGDPNMVRLYRDLLKDYEPELRPSEHHSKTLNVTFGFSLTQIIDVDERNQILTCNAWMNQMWFDQTLAWNASSYENISLIHIPNEKLWKPDIVLYNNADPQYSHALMSTDIFVSTDGNVTWLSAAIFRSSCQMNVRYYPFDTQHCTMKFASWAYDGTKIDLILNSKEGDMTNYMNSTEWELIDIRNQKNMNYFSCCEEPFPDIVITIIIRRRPMFYVFNLILPCVLITGIALLGFYMPCDSGEKVTLGITTLLSMTVFLMLVAESMPPTSDTLPLIGMYYGVTITLVSFATAMTVFTLNIHHKGLQGTPVPKLVKSFVFGVLAKLLRIDIDASQETQDESLLIESPSPHSQCQTLSGQFYAADYEREPLNPVNATLVPMAEPTNAFRNGCLLTSPRFPQRQLQSMMPSISDEDFESQFLKVLNKVYATIDRNEKRLAEQDRRDATKVEWQQVALVVDRFLLLIFVITTTLVSLLIIYQRELSITKDDF